MRQGRFGALSLVGRENGITKTGLNWLLYLVAFLNAELVAAFVDDSWGLAAYFVILLGLLMHSALDNKTIPRKFLLALSLVPLIRIVNLAMPLEEFSETYRYLLMSFPVMIGIISIIRALDLRPTDVGLISGTIPVQGLIAVTGIGFGLVAYFILEPEPIISDLTWSKAVVPALVLLFAGFVQEFAFRGVIQSFAHQLGFWGWTYIALVFSILQIGHESALYCFYILEVALFFGWTVQRRGSILGISLAHGFMNIGLYLVFPFTF
ncbi:MAG: CPBP family intramembrane metalloprotease [Planctomycetes bacterium]|nr:CPBP family intramembrane metalloprotease [Planctomycetota bacterium]